MARIAPLYPITEEENIMEEQDITEEDIPEEEEILEGEDILAEKEDHKQMLKFSSKILLT